jgi:hypothetical protein
MFIVSIIHNIFFSYDIVGLSNEATFSLDGEYAYHPPFFLKNEKYILVISSITLMIDRRGDVPLLFIMSDKQSM